MTATIAAKESGRATLERPRPWPIPVEEEPTMNHGTAGRGKKRPNYGSGRSESATNGYVRIWSPAHPLAMSDGYVLEHRLVLHRAGVVVPDGWHVHHRNHDRADNRLENLVVLSPEDHRAEHRQVGATIRNQYGTWQVLTDAERLERSRRRGRENARKRRAGFRYDASIGEWVKP